MSHSEEILSRRNINPIKKANLCFVATVPDVLFSFMKRHIQAAEKEMNVAVVSSPQRSELLGDLNARFFAMDIQRKVSPWADLKALIRLVALFRRERFDLVHSIMPKTGLLGMTAAWISRVPVRVHTFTGQVWANKQGIKRSVLKFFDRLIVLFSTHIIVDSPSQRDFLEAEKIISPGKAIVIEQGSICGVDLARFHPDATGCEQTRSELGIEAGHVVVLYLGRLNRDKGVLDLAQAVRKIATERQNIALLCVGNEEDVSFSQIEDICTGLPVALRKLPFTKTPEKYMSAADIFCLPSYREGFGQVIIEAAACGIPSVASRIYGVTDAIDDGKTGLLFKPGDAGELAQTLLRLIDDPELRNSMGLQAKARVEEKFNSDLITAQQMQIYRQALAARMTQL